MIRTIFLFTTTLSLMLIFKAKAAAEPASSACSKTIHSPIHSPERIADLLPAGGIFAGLSVERGRQAERRVRAKFIIHKDQEGREIFTAKKGQAKAAIRHSGKCNELMSVTAYQIRSPKKKTELEQSSALFFTDGRLQAVVRCEQNPRFLNLGRVCITATDKLCRSLRDGKGIEMGVIDEAEGYEKIALASILALRGPEHQLRNTVDSGDPSGLRSSLQTTRGQFLALAAQISRETGASTIEKSIQINPSKGINDANESSNEQTRKVLEHSLPVLKDSCEKGGFL